MALYWHSLVSPNPSRRTPRLACASACILAACALTLPASAGDVSFTQPQFLPGDLAPGLADGHQEQMEIAAGGGGSLAVWSDMRSSLDNFQGLDGSGLDIYGVLLDGSGNVIRGLVINEGPGDQTVPHVAWNGENWLVAWMEPKPAGLPTYDARPGRRQRRQSGRAARQRLDHAAGL